MDFDDYESLPAGNVGIHMSAGALAGVFEHIVMYPVDSVKVKIIHLITIFVFICYRLEDLLLNG